MLLLQLQHLRAEHGGEGKRRYGRYGEDHTHHPTQLLEHDTHHTASQGHGEEHGNHGERRGHYRDGHLIGGMDGGLLGVGTTLDMRGHVLEHHDGIVDHHTDGDRETGQRNHIERTVGNGQVDERGYQRDGNRDGDDEGGAPASEEEEHDYDNEQEGVEHGLGQAADRVLDILRSVGNKADLHVRGEVLLQLGQHLKHLVGDLHRVGTRLLLHYDGGTAHTIGEGHLATLLDGINHFGHIAEVDVATAHRGYDDVLHLLGVAELALYTEGERLVTDVERTTGEVHVLGRDLLADGLDAEVIGLEFHGVTVYINLTFCCTTDRYRTYTWDTSQGVADVVIKYLVESVGRLLGLNRKDHDRHHVGVELEDDGRAHRIGQSRRNHIQFIAYIVRQVINVVSELKLKRDERKILRRL